MGQGRSFFRVVDLLELINLVEHLAAEKCGRRISKRNMSMSLRQKGRSI
jgi:hypothetical protein